MPAARANPGWRNRPAARSLPDDADQVGAGPAAVVAERAVGGRAELEAVAFEQPVRRLAFEEGQPAVEDDHDLPNEREGRRGKGDRRAGRQLDMDQVEGEVGSGRRRDLA